MLAIPIAGGVLYPALGGRLMARSSISGAENAVLLKRIEPELARPGGGL